MTATLNPTDGDLVLVMDADTQLSPAWIETALKVLNDRPEVGGVGAVFSADRHGTYLTLCEHLEWVRFAEEGERTGKTFVMSGTAALIRWEALESVRHARTTRGEREEWYCTTTITEDSEISIRLKLAGWSLASPTECAVVTETMPTWRMLWLQRRRWYLGALQNARDVGLNRVTAPYWRQQALLAFSVAVMALYLTVTGLAVALGQLGTPQPLWLAVGAVFVVERVITVWGEPWRHRLFAALILPELIYALILQSAYLGAVYQFLTRSTGVWAHVQEKKVA